jgi:5-methylthioadenosine/S-adenosylhomocysteine deaminase
MFEERKAAVRLAKFIAEGASALDAWTTCRMATIDGSLGNQY